MVCYIGFMNRNLNSMNSNLKNYNELYFIENNAISIKQCSIKDNIDWIDGSWKDIFIETIVAVTRVWPITLQHWTLQNAELYSGDENLTIPPRHQQIFHQLPIWQRTTFELATSTYKRLYASQSLIICQTPCISVGLLINNVYTLLER